MFVSLVLRTFCHFQCALPNKLHLLRNLGSVFFQMPLLETSHHESIDLSLSNLQLEGVFDTLIQYSDS